MPLTAIWGNPESIWGEAEWGYFYIDPSTFPNTRVLIDWDNDGYINRGASLGDPLNLLTDPLNMVIYSKNTASASYSRDVEQTDFGQWRYRVTTGTGSNTGLAFGKDPTLVQSIKVIPGNSYYLTFWVRGVSGYSGHSFTADVVREPLDTSIASIAVSVNSGWQKVTIPFVADSNDVGIRLLRTSSTGTTVFDMTGFMLTPTEPAAFNAGHATNLYDDITEWALSYTTQLGKAKSNDTSLADGIARISLNNSERLFSPSYTAGALFGYFLPNRLVKIEIHEPANNEYVVLWSGFTGEYTASTGLTTALTAEIEASQGFSRLRNKDIDIPVMLEATADEVILAILDNVDWYPPDELPRWTLDVDALDGGTILSGADGFFDGIDVGSTTFEVIGDNWSSGKTKAFTAINEVVYGERGFFWMDRTGKLHFVNRTNYSATTSDDVVDVDHNLIDATYRYGAGLANHVSVTYYPKTSLQDTLIWESREAVEVPANDEVTTRAQLEQDSGQTLAVLSTNTFGLAAPFSTLSAIGVSSLTDLSSFVSIYTTIKNDRAELKVRNEASEDVTVNIQLRGTAIISYGGTIIDLKDDDSIFQNGVWDYSEELKLLSNEIEASAYAESLLYRRKYPFGEFETIQIKTRNYNWLARQLEYDVFTAVSISDEQTGVNDARHIIIGEKHRWRPLILESTFVTEHAGQFSWWVLDVSTLDETTYLGI